MGILDNIERGLERAVNGAFAKTFRSGLQPIEITAALRRELDTKAVIVSRDRTLAPNEFTVRLAPSDRQKMSELGRSLIDELTALVQQHAAGHQYTFAGPIRITLDSDDRLSPGVVQVDSTTLKGQISWHPVIDVNGRRFPITKGTTVIGRGSEADITIDDAGASRYHLEILWDGSRAQARDLGSTNGTKIDGGKIGLADLADQTVLSVGRTRIVFRMLAQAAADPFADRRMPPSGGRA